MFTCQKCRRPLKVLDRQPIEESTLLSFGSEYPLPPYLNEDYKKKEQAAVELLGESFVVLPAGQRSRDSQKAGSSVAEGGQATNAEAKIVKTSNLDDKLNALTTIFEIASDKCQLDQPLCSSCNTAIVSELDARLTQVRGDNQAFTQQLQRLQRSSISPETVQEQDRLLAEIQKEEEEILENLHTIKLERAALKDELAKLEDETQILDKFEESFWKDHSDFRMELEQLGNEQQQVQEQIANTARMLEALKRTNVYDDAFHISYDGHFGTINGFRLGRLASQAVDWKETNAGLGQIALLLHTIAARCNYQFQKYTLIPMGSFSKIAKVDDPKAKHELFGHNDLSIGRLFWYRRFDTALVWLLECVKEFGDFAQSADAKFKLHYPIHNDKVGGASIKLQFSQDTTWTKALKNLLTNLKLILVWVSQQP